MELTKKNIKTLKYEKRTGFVFSGLVIAFGALLNLGYIISNEENGWLLLLLIDLGIVGLSYFIAFFMNRKINKDLRAGTKDVKIEKIERKKHEIDYEAGSGALFIPILGNLFPKLWGQKMKEYSKYTLVVNGVGFDVEKELFDSVVEGDLIEIHYSKYSEILLESNKQIKLPSVSGHPQRTVKIFNHQYGGIFLSCRTSIQSRAFLTILSHIRMTYFQFF